MSPTFTLAHLSDLHLGPLVGLTPQHWNLKRLAGFLNWQRKRRHVHDPATLRALIADLAREAPDHVAVTGDLVNLGLPAEHARALGLLAEIGPPDRVTVVPGNHDIYARLWRDPGVRRWQAYMAGDGTPTHAFPFVRRRGGIALIGLNSAVPTPPAVASGRLGSTQIDAAREALARLRAEGLWRVVLIHHPALRALAPPHRGLRDADALTDMLAEVGAELVLHGHNHRNERSWIQSATGPVPIVGIASASAALAHKDESLARYHLYRFAGAPGRGTIEFFARGLADPGGPMMPLERGELSAPATAAL